MSPYLDPASCPPGSGKQKNKGGKAVKKQGKKPAKRKRPTREEKEQYILDFLRTEVTIAFVAFWGAVKGLDGSPFKGMSESTFRRTLKSLAKQRKVRLDKTDNGVYFVDLVDKSGGKNPSKASGEKPASEATIATSAVVRSREFRKAREAADAASAVLDDLVGDATGSAPAGSPAAVLAAAKEFDDPRIRQMAELLQKALDEESERLRERQKTDEELEEEIAALLKQASTLRNEAGILDCDARDLSLLKSLRHRLMTTKPLPPAPPPSLPERFAEIIK